MLIFGLDVVIAIVPVVQRDMLSAEIHSSAGSIIDLIVIAVDNE
jgi:uncharacterized MnhB-related membrane protein